MKSDEHYMFIHALRPFSLVVAVVAAGLGILIAWRDGWQNLGEAFLVMLGAVLAQAGVNLVNDLEDKSFLTAADQAARAAIARNAQWGGVFFVGCFLIAAYFSWQHGAWFFACVCGVALLALSYNLGPINFKRRGLALVQVFFLMGIFLVQGAYLALTGEFSLQAVWLSLPVSVLVSLLLLSNELRDWESDAALGVRTLTVRIGYRYAVALYFAMVMLAFALAFALLDSKLSAHAWVMLAPLAVLLPIVRAMKAERRVRLTPLTGRYFFVFGMAWMYVLSH